MRQIYFILIYSGFIFHETIGADESICSCLKMVFDDHS